MLAVLVGLSLVAATCHATIEFAGGYRKPYSYVMMAIASGVGIGALVFGASWNQRRRILAGIIAVALLCGEAYGLIMTGERLIAAREEKEARVRAAQLGREDLKAESAGLNVALFALTTSPRLTAAIEMQRAAAQDIKEKAALRGCASNCRKLLEDAREEADQEIADARSALTDARRSIEAKIAAAEAQLATVEVPPSSTPLADRMGIEPWLRDLIAASLGSIAANGLACCLLEFGAHHPRRWEAIVEEKAKAVPADGTTQAVYDEREQARDFIVEVLHPQPSAMTPLADIRSAYLGWCDENGIEPQPPHKIVPAMIRPFDKAGLRGEQVDGKPIVYGVTVKERLMIEHQAA